MSEASAGARLRWATEEDNEALIDLVRQCPMQGDFHLFFDRSPDYFALSRIQGAGARVAVIEASEPGRLAAAAALASYPHCHVNGQVLPAFYACDLRVAPDQRRKGYVRRLHDFLTEWGVSQGGALGFMAVLAQNRAMDSILGGQQGRHIYRPVGTMANFTVQFLLARRAIPGITIRRATERDVPEMVELWNRVNGAKQFAPRWSEKHVTAAIEQAPGLALDQYWLAYRQSRLVGLCATWDQSSFKRMTVLGYGPTIRRIRPWYNLVSSGLGLAPIPQPGALLNYFYVTQICAETPRDLRALYTAIYNENRKKGYHFFDTMLDRQDPLISALNGFMAPSVDIRLFAMDPLERFGDQPLDTRPAYFDPSTV
ncbi:MAG: GNAT family N-acetyltransferase [bacterium]|nr:GNAT family N-acetyltransferase [bacterium]